MSLTMLKPLCKLVSNLLSPERAPGVTQGTGTPGALNRRGFLKFLGAGAAVAAAAPLIPFNRVWSFPSPGKLRTTGNIFLDTQWVTAEYLHKLQANLDYFSTDWEQDLRQNFAVGVQIEVKFPQKFIVRESHTVTLDQVRGADLYWEPLKKGDIITIDSVNTVNPRGLKDFSRRYLEPAARQLRNDIDRGGLIGECKGFDWDEEVDWSEVNEY